MGDRKIIAVLFGLMLILVVPLTLDDSVFADKKGKKNTTAIINLGYLQLAAHDFFNMNRCTDILGFSPDPDNLPNTCEEVVPFEFESENGKLDASTVLFNPKGGDCDFKTSLIGEPGDYCVLYTPEQIRNGGESRSAENIMILTAGAEVGEKYLKLVEKYDGNDEKAYKKTLEFYHKQIKKAYEESFHLKFPKAKEGDVTNLHNLAVRIGHDFLPKEIMINGETKIIFEIPHGDKLNKKEKRQQSLPLDGMFHDIYTHIEGFCNQFFCVNVDLLKADHTFGEQFAFDVGHKYDQYLDSTTFQEFLDEVSDGKFNKKDRVSKLLKDAFAFGLSFDK